MHATLFFQFVASLIALLVASALQRLGSLNLRLLRRGFDSIARRKWLAVSLVGGLAFTECAAIGLLVHFPQPAIHDEFCYLLGADTFAHGRLTNPTHSQWEHFESFHIIHQPTYQMKYPPAQSLALALGQVIWHPALGVWFSVGAACAGLCWMLQAWVPPRWALLGSLLAVFSCNIIFIWGETYWGGAVAMLGGCLVFGGLRRMVSAAKMKNTLPFAVGLVVLANSRPYEGLVAALPTLLVLIHWLLSRKRPTWSALALRIVFPALLVLVPAAAWMGYYNYRVSGDPLRMPYQVWEQTYGSGNSVLATMFSFSKHRDGSQPQRKIPFPNRSKVSQPSSQSAPPSSWRVYLRKVVTPWSFYLGPLLTIPVVTLPWVLRSRWMRFAAFTVFLVMLSVVLQSTYGHAHYVAPIACLALLLVVQAMRHFAHLGGDSQGAGRVFVRTIPVLLAASFVFSIIIWDREPDFVFRRWSLRRSAFIDELQAGGKKHLVVVRYAPQHDRFREWVYNGADIDAQQVVWARQLSAQQNAQLLEYFAEREIWLLVADEPGPRLVRHIPGAPDSIIKLPPPEKAQTRPPESGFSPSASQGKQSSEPSSAAVPQGTAEPSVLARP